MATHKPVDVDEIYGDLILPEKDDQKWNVIHTKPQCEKKLADFLKSRKIIYYLPLYDSERVYQHRRVVFTKPLFPGYIFSCFNMDEKFNILNSGYAVRLIKVPNQNELLNDLYWIYQSRQEKLELEQNEWFESGWYVEIIDGPMKGMRGTVQSQTRLSEVILNVNILKQSVKLKLNPSHVKVLTEFQRI